MKTKIDLLLNCTNLRNVVGQEGDNWDTVASELYDVSCMQEWQHDEIPECKALSLIALVFFSITMGLGSCLHLPLLAAAGSTVPETRHGHTDNLLRMRWCGNCCGWQEVGAAHELDDVTLWEEPTTLEGGARPGVKGQEWGQERDDEFTLEVHKCGWEELWYWLVVLQNHAD